MVVATAPGTLLVLRLRIAKINCITCDITVLFSTVKISVDGFTYVAEACSSLQQIVLDNLPTLTDICVQVHVLLYVLCTLTSIRH